MGEDRECPVCGAAADQYSCPRCGGCDEHCACPTCERCGRQVDEKKIMRGRDDEPLCERCWARDTELQRELAEERACEDRCDRQRGN